MNFFRLMLITDDAGRSAGQLRAIVEEALLGGVTAVQLREKRASTAQLLTLLRKLAPICRRAGAPLLVNGSLLGRLTGALEADGVHFGAASVIAETGRGEPPAEGRPLSLPADFDFHEAAAAVLGRSGGPPPLVGYSAHSYEEVRMVLARHADYVTLSPVFETASKPGQPPSGTGLIATTRALLPQARLIGLGGIDSTNAADVIRAGADGVAVIRAIMSSTDPRAAARALRHAVDSASDRP